MEDVVILGEKIFNPLDISGEYKFSVYPS